MMKSEAKTKKRRGFTPPWTIEANIRTTIELNVVIEPTAEGLADGWNAANIKEGLADGGLTMYYHVILDGEGECIAEVIHGDVQNREEEIEYIDDKERPVKLRLVQDTDADNPVFGDLLSVEQADLEHPHLPVFRFTVCGCSDFDRAKKHVKNNGGPCLMSQMFLSSFWGLKAPLA